MTTYHLAQLNIARPRAEMTDPVMADFAKGLEPLNALADASPGFVWRLVGETDDDATSLRPYGPDIMLNLSVWTSVEALREYTYRTVHLDALRRRQEWFTHEGLAHHLVLWWLPAGELPTVEEAWSRLKRLLQDGPSPAAFTLRHPHPAPATSP